MARTKTDQKLEDEIAEIYGRAQGNPDILLIHAAPDGKLGMRICGFRSPADRWRAVAALEWAKYEIITEDQKEHES